MSGYKPERYFYTLHDPMRWLDPYATPQGDQRRVLTMAELKDRHARNQAYSAWLKRFTFQGEPLKGKTMLWQAIQVMSKHHSDNRSDDWWHPFLDCLFRVWMTPETRKCPVTKDWKQWYVVCPEDGELINRSLLKHQGISIPPRQALEGERYFSKDKRLRRCMLIPTECCRHWRHETTAGKVDLLL